MHRGYTEKKRKKQKRLDLEIYIPFWQLVLNCGKVTRQKKEGVGAPRDGKLWEDNMEN